MKRRICFKIDVHRKRWMKTQLTFLQRPIHIEWLNVMVWDDILDKC